MSAHTYENATYDEMHDVDIEDKIDPASSAAPVPSTASSGQSTTTRNNMCQPNNINTRPTALSANRAANAIESPFVDPCQIEQATMTTTSGPGTNNLVIASKPQVHSIVTKLIPSGNVSQSPMDSLKEWSVSTFKCTKQRLEEKLGKCSRTFDGPLEAEIERLRENQRKYTMMLNTARSMSIQYSSLVHTQRQLCELMNEMALKYTAGGLQSNFNSATTTVSLETTNGAKLGSKQASKVSVSNNSLASSSTTTSPSPAVMHKTASSNYPADFAPILNHIKMTSNSNLSEDFRKNALVLSIAAKNGEKLCQALSFFCANLSTLVHKTIEDTLFTIRAFEAARLEYDAERNSLNQVAPTLQTSVVVSSDKLNATKSRYEQLREDVLIKIRFLDENKFKVMHKQLVLFNSAFASYTSGNTAALEAALKQFSIR